jgi:hypothetical protein
VPEPRRDDDPARDDPGRAPSPSARVRLEVDLLASEQPAALGDTVGGDERQRLVVLVVAGDADVRRYVRECLRDRSDLRVLEAAAPGPAAQIAAAHHPQLLIVDARDSALLGQIGDVRAVVIADELPLESMPATVAVLVRPFGGRDLQAVVDAVRATT